MTAYRHTFDTPEQTVTEALFLALIAPDEGKAKAASWLAGVIIAQNGFDEATVALCRAAALER